MTPIKLQTQLLHTIIALTRGAKTRFRVANSFAVASADFSTLPDFSAFGLLRRIDLLDAGSTEKITSLTRRNWLQEVIGVHVEILVFPIVVVIVVGKLVAR